MNPEYSYKIHNTSATLLGYLEDHFWSIILNVLNTEKLFDTTFEYALRPHYLHLR